MLTCVAPRFRRFTLPTYPADFNVYYCASSLVRQGQADALYGGADTGADPQKAVAAPDTPIARVAHAQGLTFVGLYVYPPVLADLLLPYTRVPIPVATELWLATSGVLLGLTAFAVVRMLGLRLFSWGSALVFVSLACFTPALQCLVDGQITICLLFLWAAGMLLYQREHEAASGAVFALATAIKLTPAIILLPFLVWRRWRLLGAFVGTLFALALLAVRVNSAHTLWTFIARVLPAMSGATPVFSNYSLPASVQRLLTLFETGTVPPYPGVLPPATVLAGRAASMLGALALVALLIRAGRLRDRQDHLVILGLLSLLAPVLSPVSWFHAYTTAYLAFAMLWSAALRSPESPGYLAVLTLVSLCLGSALSENLIPSLLFSGHAALSAVLHTAQLLAAIGLVFFQLWRLGSQQQPRSRARPTPSSHPSPVTP